MPIASINTRPIEYPNTPPSTEPTEQYKANLKDFRGIDIARAINRTSGGIGKKDDSANARMNNAGTPYGVSAQCSTQS